MSGIYADKRRYRGPKGRCPCRSYVVDEKTGEREYCEMGFEGHDDTTCFSCGYKKEHHFEQELEEGLADDATYP